MLKIKSLLWFPLMLLILSGCQTMTALNFVPDKTQTSTFREGSLALKSTLPNSTVILSSASTQVENGSRIDIVASVNNTSENSFIVDTESFKISSPETGSLRVFSYQELVAEEKKRANSAAALAAFAGVLDSMAASYSGYQTTTGSYSGNTYGSYSGNSYGTYNANTYGTYSATTYNSAAAQQAMNAANDRMTNNLQNIQQTSGATLQNLKNNILKKTTLEKDMWYGGIVRFEAPALKKDERRTYRLTVSIGSEVHEFILNQTIIKD